MAQVKLKNGFERLNADALLGKAKYIRSSLHQNPNFTDPSPTLESVDETIALLDVATQKAATGNRQDIIARDSIKEELVDKLHLLSNYVLYAGANNEMVVATSGFTLAKPPAPRPGMGAPEGVNLANGINPGELDMRCKKVAGAVSYVWEYTEGPVTENSVWSFAATSCCKHTFTGLRAGTAYHCRVAAIGPREQRVYSGILSRIVV